MDANKVMPLGTVGQAPRCVVYNYEDDRFDLRSIMSLKRKAQSVPGEIT